MITGKPRDPEEEEEVNAEEDYRFELAFFFGEEGRFYGIEDELHDLGELIKVVGKTVISEEAEFHAVQRREQENAGEDYQSPTEGELAVWHKLKYRQFTYKAMISLIQSTFEAGAQRLHALLTAEGQIEDLRKDREKLGDTLKDFAQLDPSLAAYWDQVRPFMFIRNKVGHQDGVYYKGDSNVDAFESFVEHRTDIKVTDEGILNGKHSFRMKITKSTVLTDYLNLVKEIFSELYKTAINRPVVSKK
ncbi:hypothetical protein ECE50_009240 [Chitinophaga sp. Mgbs1]|uniref:Uncharacterized protein n=1 Tax=Chitinophaga solisilvae TaxID=1233460 RepID=A0A433WMU1_9BACT|nr:hypothetical protein [Chitinophaga solisilvae]